MEATVRIGKHTAQLLLTVECPSCGHRNEIDLAEVQAPSMARASIARGDGVAPVACWDVTVECWECGHEWGEEVITITGGNQ